MTPGDIRRAHQALLEARAFIRDALALESDPMARSDLGAAEAHIDWVILSLEERMPPEPDGGTPEHEEPAPPRITKRGDVYRIDRSALEERLKKLSRESFDVNVHTEDQADASRKAWMAWERGLPALASGSLPA